MKEINADVVLRKILKKKDSCTARELNEWKDTYNKKHPNGYVDICKDTIIWAVENNPDEFYWGGEGDEGITVIKQEIIYCPVCGDKHRKYPNTEAFELLIKIKEHLKKMFNH
jgi:hypothetical protein